MGAKPKAVSPDELVARIQLGLSILQQRRFCPDDLPHVQEAILALLGATVDELRTLYHRTA